MAINENSFDLAIVGASFAGLVAARTAAMRGLKVAVLEIKPEAGARVATTGILVREAAEEIDIPHHLTRRVHGVRLYAPNLKYTDLFAPGYYFLTTDTPNLLRWLASEAERAGAKIFYSTPFTGAGRNGDVFNFQFPEISARYILGADGAQSAVARYFDLGHNTKFLIGLEAEYEGLETLDGRFLHCFLNSRLAPGYIGWVAPGPGITQVGLAASSDARADLKGFLAATGPIFRYWNGKVVGRRSGRIPCGGLVQPWAMPGVMLIGDAAGLVSPATGGGISLAFRFGRRAAHAIASYILDLGPPPETVLKDDLPRFGLKHTLRRALDLAPPNALINLALATTPMRHFAKSIYFHQRNRTELTLAGYEAELSARVDFEKSTEAFSNIQP